MLQTFGNKATDTLTNAVLNNNFELPDVQIATVPQQLLDEETLNAHDEEEDFLQTPAPQFPDPWAQKHIIARFFVGITYVFQAIGATFTEGYILFAIIPALFVMLFIIASFALGIFLGIIIVTSAWKPKPAVEWTLLGGWFYINFGVLWYFAIVLACMMLVGLFLFISVIILKPCLDVNAKDLSYIVEQRMKGKPIHYFFTHKITKTAKQIKTAANDIAKAMDVSQLNLINSNDDHAMAAFPKPEQQDDDEEVEFFCCSFCCKWTCLTPEWWENLVQNTIDKLVKRTVQSIVRTVIRYGINAIVTLITNILMFVFGWVLPGIGLVIQIIVFYFNACYQTSMVGMEIVMQRKKYTYVQMLATAWNNLSLFLGLGCGLTILMALPCINLCFYPVMIISTTRLFVHLDAHHHTASTYPPTVKVLGYKTTLVQPLQGNFFLCVDCERH